MIDFDELENRSEYMNEVIKIFSKSAFESTEEEHWIKRTTKKLIVDDEFKSALVNWAKGKWKLCGEDLTLEAVEKLLAQVCRIVGLNKIDPSTKSGYAEEWHSGERFEGDMNPEDPYTTVRNYALTSVIGEMPDDLKKFDAKTEWIKEEN